MNMTEEIQTIINSSLEDCERNDDLQECDHLCWLFDQVEYPRYLLYGKCNVLIIYNTNNRPESEGEAHCIYDAFQSTNQFNVKLCMDKEENDMLQLIEESANQGCFGLQPSALIVVLLSHGSEGVIDDCHGKPVGLTKIEELMCQKKLQNRPKILITQCCQTRDNEPQFYSPAQTSDVKPPRVYERQAYIPTHPDFCSLMSCAPGEHSEREVFIPILAEQISNCKRNEPIELVFQRACTQMAAQKSTQTPVIHSTFKAAFCPMNHLDYNMPFPYKNRDPPKSKSKEAPVGSRIEAIKMGVRNYSGPNKKNGEGSTLNQTHPIRTTRDSAEPTDPLQFHRQNKRGVGAGWIFSILLLGFTVALAYAEMNRLMCFLRQIDDDYKQMNDRVLQMRDLIRMYDAECLTLQQIHNKWRSASLQMLENSVEMSLVNMPVLSRARNVMIHEPGTYGYDLRSTTHTIEPISGGIALSTTEEDVAAWSPGTTRKMTSNRSILPTSHKTSVTFILKPALELAFIEVIRAAIEDKATIEENIKSINFVPRRKHPTETETQCSKNSGTLRLSRSTRSMDFTDSMKHSVNNHETVTSAEVASDAYQSSLKYEILVILLIGMNIVLLISAVIAIPVIRRCQRLIMESEGKAPVFPPVMVEKSEENEIRRGPDKPISDSKAPNDTNLKQENSSTPRPVEESESAVLLTPTLSEEPIDCEPKMEEADAKIFNNGEVELVEHKESLENDNHVLSASELTHADDDSNEETDDEPNVEFPNIRKDIYHKDPRVKRRMNYIVSRRQWIPPVLSDNIASESLKTATIWESSEKSLFRSYVAMPSILVNSSLCDHEAEEPHTVTCQDKQSDDAPRLSNNQPDEEFSKAEIELAVPDVEPLTENQPESDPTEPESDPTELESEPTKPESDPTKPESHPTKPESLNTSVFSSETISLLKHGNGGPGSLETSVVTFTNTNGVEPSSFDTSWGTFTETDISILKNRGALRNNIPRIHVQPNEEEQVVVPNSSQPGNDIYGPRKLDPAFSSSTANVVDNVVNLKSTDGKQSIRIHSSQKPCFDNITDAEARLSGFTKNSYDRNGDIVRLKCESCGIILSSQPAEDVTLIDIHAQKTPYCPFIVSRASSAVDEVTRSSEELDVTDGTSSVVPNNIVIRQDPTSTQTTRPSLLPFLKSAGSENENRILNLTTQYARTLKGSDESKETLDNLGLRTNDNDLQQMGREENRKKTFLTYPNHKALKLTGFVDNGWFWTGVEDEYKCFRCDAVCSDWHSSVDPLARHIQLSPDCPFLLAQYTPEYRERISKENPTYTTPKPQDVIKNPPSRLIRPHAETRYATMIVDNYCKFYDPIDREIVSADEGLNIRTVGKKMIWRVMAYSIQYGIEVHSEDKILSILQIIRENKRSSLAESSGASAQKGPKATALPDFIQYDEEIRQKLLKSIHPASKPKVQSVKVVMNVDEVREQLRCTICLDSLRSVLFTPCCHLAACAQCGFTQALCPVCRRKIQATIKVNVLPSSTLALKNKGKPM